MPIATVNWLWIGSRSQLDPTPGTPITMAQRSAILGYGAAGKAAIKPTAVTGDYVLQEVNGYNFASVWGAAAKNVAPTRFSYELDGAPVGNVTMNTAFAVTMRVQTSSQPDLFQDQKATLVQMSNGDLFFRPHVDAVAAWDTIDRVYSVQVAAIDGAAGTAYGSISERVTFDRDIFDVAFPCFVAGTLILTDRGERPVETLRPGDLVATADHGLRPIRWIGSSVLEQGVLARNPALLPVRIAASALGPGIPARDLFVSQQHRILVRSRIAARLFGATEILVAAKHLVGLDGITIPQDRAGVTYLHFMFDRHEIVVAEGTQTESLYAGPQAVRMLPPASLSELRSLFPGLCAGEAPPPARPFATGSRRRDLIHRHRAKGRPLVSGLSA
ncbi:Hint domain-containing protein [Paracoccus shandongensis]|uniref:Hint domain-containing protein n=1 Tax=Paracoccus shandongensis TaxID=2816048 RepID=UPI001A8FAD0C|nr:Hint domain-containing protein [Paracoccus shandongensis]